MTRVAVLSCAFEECEIDGNYSRSLCRKHYNYAHKHGRLDLYARIYKEVDRGPKPTCCGLCGEPFNSSPVRDTWTATCSKSCARKLEIEAGTHPLAAANRTPEETAARLFRKGEEARRKRRARLAKVARDSYTTASIAERDERICGLCGEVVELSVSSGRIPTPQPWITLCPYPVVAMTL